MRPEEIDYCRQEFFHEAHRLAFKHYICWGRVPKELTEIMENTISMKAFLNYARKYNPNHKPAGSPEGGQFDFAPGGGEEYNAELHARDKPLGHAHEVDAALVAGLVAAMRAPSLLATGIEGMAIRAVRSHILNTIKPGGSYIGKPGTSSTIRMMSKDQTAEEFLPGLVRGRKETPNPELAEEGGRLYKMQDGTHITYRPRSKSGPATINIQFPGSKRPIKLKFPGGE